MNSQLLSEVLKRIELVCCVKVFVVFTMAALYFTIVTRRVRTNQLVLYTTLFERTLKQCEIVGFGATEALGKFKSIVRLDALHPDALFCKMFDDM